MKLITRILLVLQILFAVLLLIAYATAYIDPIKFVWLVPFSFLVPLLLILNIIFIPIWLFIKRKYLIISSLLIILGLPQIMALLPIKSYFTSTTKCENEIKLITYNVDLFGLYNWKENEQNKSNIFRFLESEKPDITCFQEYFYTDNNYFVTTDSLTKILNTKNYYQDFSAKVDAGHQYFGMATFSKFPIINKGSIKFEKTHNMCIFTDIVIENDTIRIYNCHLQSLYFDDTNYSDIENMEQYMLPDANLLSYKNVVKKVIKASKKRSSQINILRNHIDSCQYKLIVCGDFNDNPFSNSYHKISKNLKDSFSSAGKGMGYTWEYSKVKQRIDYVLYDKQISCNSHKVVELKYSDHFPIIVNLCLK